MRAMSRLSVASWNIAAVNNNPWEYWITYEGNPQYDQLMKNIEDFIEAPGERDVPVSTVFNQEMFQSLKQRMEAEQWPGIDQVERLWNDSFAPRKIISGFLKDKSLGAKRLASMPDRMTNTINLAQPEGDQICRPSVINVYESDSMASIEGWYREWLRFVFDTSITVYRRGSTEDVESKRICTLFPPIKQSKYPAITPEEEAISVPLQVLCLAIFDSILLHMMNTVSPQGEWIAIKKELCDKLNKQKVTRTCQILDSQYATSDVLALQECGAVFIKKLETYGQMGDRFHVLTPENMDQSRDQNSVMLLNKSRFVRESVNEITDAVLSELAKVDAKSPVAPGDLFAVTVKENNNEGTPMSYLVASFHGDTNGLATVPIMKALCTVWSQHYQDHSLIFCLDANTYEKGSASQQGVQEFASAFCEQGLTSCFGDAPAPDNYTTFNARTYLQPQLNKACKSSEKHKGDVNPKDFILFSRQHWVADSWCKDNTGDRRYVEGIVFPTLSFPSDHGVLSTELHLKE